MERNRSIEEVKLENGNKSREFYEFVLPPVDMHLENNTLVITVDVPGFKKDDIQLTINGNILSIKAKKRINGDKKNEIVCNQRPNILDKKIRLPLNINGEEKVNSAEYIEGVLTIKIPTTSKKKPVSIS